MPDSLFDDLPEAQPATQRQAGHSPASSYPQQQPSRNPSQLEDAFADIPESGYDQDMFADIPMAEQQQDDNDGGVLSDLARGLGKGSGRVTEGIGTIYGLATGDMDNAARKWGKDAAWYYEQGQSDELERRKEARQANIEAADGEGAKAWQAIKSTATDLRLMGDFVAEQLPMFVPGVGVGRAAGAGAVALGAGAKVAGRTATAGAVGAGAGLQGADAGGDAYDRIMELPEFDQAIDVYAEALESGATEQQAKEATALSLSRTAALQSGAVSAIVNVLPGASSLERVLAGGGRVAGGRIAGAIRGLLGESASEAVDEAGGVLASNNALQQVDSKQSLTEGIGEAAGMGALAGVFGAPAGAMNAGGLRTDQEPDPSNDGSYSENPSPDPVTDQIRGANLPPEQMARLNEGADMATRVQRHIANREPTLEEIMAGESARDSEQEVADMFGDLPTAEDFEAESQEQANNALEIDNTGLPDAAAQPEINQVVDANNMVPTQMSVPESEADPFADLPTAAPPSPETDVLQETEQLPEVADAEIGQGDLFGDLPAASNEAQLPDTEVEAFEQTLTEHDAVNDDQLSLDIPQDSSQEPQSDESDFSEQRYSVSGNKPDDVVLTGSGHDAFGEITAEIAESAGIPAGAIRLNVGEHRGDHKGYGLEHISAQRREEIESTGMTVPQFVHHTLNNYTQIWKTESGRLAMVKSGDRGHAAIIELMQDTDGSYSVVTAYPVKSRYKKFGELVWKGRAHRQSYLQNGAKDLNSQRAPFFDHKQIIPPEPNTGNQNGLDPALETLRGETNSQNIGNQSANNNDAAQIKTDATLTPAVRTAIKAGMVKVVNSDTFPAHIAEQIKADGYSPSQIEGLARDGVVYVNTDKATTDEKLDQILRHEVAHVGMQAVFGKKLNKLLDSIARSNDPHLKEVRTFIGRKYRKQLNGKTGQEGSRLVAEELIAHYAEKSSVPGVIEHAYLRIQRLFKDLFGRNYSMSDVRGILASANKGIERGKGGNRYLQNEQRYSTTGDGPNDYIITPAGSTSFGEITPELAKAIGRQAAPIRLEVGREDGERKFGVVHIRMSHGDQIENNGVSIPEFVHRVTSNPVEIRKGGGGAILLAADLNVSGKSNDVAVLRLAPSDSGDFYRVETAMTMVRKRFEKKFPLLWKRATYAPADTGLQPFVADNRQSTGAEDANSMIKRSKEGVNIENTGAKNNDSGQKYKVGDDDHASETLNRADSKPPGRLKKIGWKLWNATKEQSWGLLSRRQVVEIAEHVLPRSAEYLRHAEQMDADKNELQVKGSQIAGEHRTFASEHEAEANKLARIQQAATIAGYDPDAEYEALITEEEAKKSIERINNQIRQYAREIKNDQNVKRLNELYKERDEVAAKLAAEKTREKSAPVLDKAWAALSEDAKSLYRRERDYFSELEQEKQDAIIERIMASQVAFKSKQELVGELRQEFEDRKVTAPYFPLARFGQYWVRVGNGDTASVDFFETAQEQKNFIKTLEASGETKPIERGKNTKSLLQEDGMSTDTLLQIDELINNTADIRTAETLRDAIYQLYLEKLPGLSQRKHYIHRKAVRGFSEDAIRAFSQSAFHTAHQVARLRHSNKMSDAISQMDDDIKAGTSAAQYEVAKARLSALETLQAGDVSEANLPELRKQSKRFRKAKDWASARIVDQLIKAIEVYGGDQSGEWLQAEIDSVKMRIASADAIRSDAKNPEFATNAYEELRKAHEFAMNPNVSPVATGVNQFGFLWMLSVSPAAAIVNMTQVPMVTLPAFGAKFGHKKASFELTRAMRQLRFDNWTITAKLKGDEAKMYAELQRRGVIDKSMAHDLAGLSEEGQQYSDTWHKVMGAASWQFHNAEVVNRTVTALAGYRLARQQGMDHASAVNYSHKATLDTQFDYSGTNRARVVRGNYMRVAMQFKQYSQALIYLWARAAHQSFKGQSKEVRRDARKQFLGLLAMQQLVTGFIGLPTLPFGYAAAMITAALTEAGDDGEDPFIWKSELQSMMADAFGQDIGRALSKGIVDGFTPVSIHGRTSANELLIRSPDKQDEGRDLGVHYLSQAAGPVFGGVGMDAFAGGKLIAEGEVWRGLEKLTPKFAKDMMKAYRYSQEGSETLSGHKIRSFSDTEVFFQAIGFSSSENLAMWDRNIANKDKEAWIQKRRSRIVNKVNEAVRKGENTLRDEWLQKLQSFNEAHPGSAITGNDVQSSVKSWYTRDTEMQEGMHYGKKFKHTEDMYTY